MEEFRISFNKLSKEYNSGEYVTGQVEIGTIEQLTIEGLSVRFFGCATIFSRKKRVEIPEQGQTYDGSELYFDETINLCGSCTIEPNKKHAFPFQYKLPDKSMPRACQNSEGKVFYTAEATLKRPSIFQSNVKESEDFFMLTNVNLNSFPEAEAPGKASDSWSNTFACCLKKSRVLLTCSTPYKGVCPGKMIPFQITVKNQTGREVKNVKVELVQKWVYWCSGNTKRVNVIVKKIPRTFQVPARCDLEWKDSLRVPADLFQPTQGTNLCRVINVDYVLRFTPIQDFTCCNVPVIEIPIYIGDIPLAKHTYSDAHIQFHGDHKNVHIRQGDGESDLWRKSNMSVVRKSNHSIHKKK